MKPNRPTTFLATAFLACLAPAFAQDAPTPEPPAPTPAPAPAPVLPSPTPTPPKVNNELIIPEWQLAFENLERNTQIVYSKHIFEATRLFNQKRIIEALNELAEAEKIFDRGPAALNLKGACYVEFRAFERARAIFEEAFELQKAHMENLEGIIGAERRRRMRPVVNILFNIAEMDFVMGNWQECLDRIAIILPVMDPTSIAMSRLIEFKLMLCKLKLKQVDEARELSLKYDWIDDNPYYYYANSAMAYFDGDEQAAERWRASARRVFRRPEVLAPWEDTMIEFGYVKSFYGGDLAEEE